MLSFIKSQAIFCCPVRHSAKNGDDAANLESLTEVEDFSEVEFFTDVKLGVAVKPMTMSSLTDVEDVALFKDVKDVAFVKNVEDVAFFKDVVAEPIPIWSREIPLSRVQSLSTLRF